MLTLYYAPGSSSFAAHIALTEVGASFESHRLSIPEKETRTPDYLAINPAGKVPALLVDGRVLTEVAAILFYLAKRYPEAGLLPPWSVSHSALPALPFNLPIIWLLPLLSMPLELHVFLVTQSKWPRKPGALSTVVSC